MESSVATVQPGNRRRLMKERWDLLAAVLASLGLPIVLQIRL